MEFATPYEKATIPKPQRLGRELLGRIYKRDINAGGSFSEITGAPGSGKTSVMLSLAKRIMNDHKKELVFFSSSFDSPLQFFPIYKYHILVSTENDIKFWDRYKEEYVDLSHDTFESYDELYSKAKLGVLNCVFFGDRTEWMNFISWLKKKSGWCTVLIDEISEICPASTANPMFNRIKYFANHTLGQSRRCLLTIISNTQATTDTDHRVRKKLNMRIYLPGARVDAKATRVKQKAIDNLNEDHTFGSQCYISAGGQFGIFRSTDIFKPVPGISIEAQTSFRNIDNYGVEGTEETSNKVNSHGRSQLPNRVDEFLRWQDRWDNPTIHNQL